MNNTLRKRLQTYLQRDSRGHLIYPLCVKAHFLEIMKYSPDALTGEECRYFSHLK